MPVRSPRALIATGKKNGVTVRRIPRIMVPLIMLPNRRTANASVRDNSLMMLKGSMIALGCR